MRAKDIPVILYTMLEEPDIDKDLYDLKDISPGGIYLRKEQGIQSLIRRIRETCRL